METIKLIVSEKDLTFSDTPKINDTWNAHITNLSNLGHIHVAGCVTPKLGINDCNLILFIGPDTSRADIIQDWENIKDIRNKLKSYQGSLPKIELPYRQTVFILHNDYKLGYTEIARILNFEILVLIYLGLGEIKEKSVLNTDQYYSDFEQLLVSFGFTENDIKEFKLEIADGLKNDIVTMNPLIEPITTKQVREAIRSFSKLVKSNNINLDKRKTRLLKFLSSGDANSALEQIVLKTYPSEKRKIRRYLKKWLKLKVHILRDRILDIDDYALKSATMGDLDQFFP